MTAPDLRVLAISHWPRRWRDEFEERAAIIQFQGNVPRALAEQNARAIVVAMWERETNQEGKR